MTKVKLKDVIKRAQTKVDKDNTNLLYYVGGEHIDSENIRVQKRGLIAGSTIGPMFYYGFKAGDFLLVSRNPHLKKAGLVDFDGICSEKTFVLETSDKKKLLPEFLPFILQNERFWGYAFQHRHGSTNTFINWSTLSNYEFDLPDLETQRKLATVLWSINDTIESYKNLVSATDELVKSQFIELFGDPVCAESGIIGKDLFSLASGKANTIANLSDEYEYECYGGNGVTGHSKGYLVKEPTIAIGRVGEYCGSVHITSPFSWITDNAIYITSYDRKQICLDFLYIECQIMDFHRFAATVGQPKITQKPILEQLYIVPSLKEQEQFVTFVHQSDKSKFELNRALDELTATYKQIIKDNLG